MLFIYNISTPANTAVTAKQKTLMKLGHGIITLIEIQFPPGPNGLLHLHINDALHQVFPFNPTGNFASSNAIIRFRDFIPILNAPFEFQAFTWNEDDTYDHRVIIRIGILPVRVAAPWLLSFDERLDTVIGGA